MIRFISMVLLWILPVVSHGAAGKEDFEYGARPPTSVFDPDDLLDGESEDRLAEALAKTRREDKIDIMVVVLKDLGDAPPGHVAKRFQIAWCEDSIHAVILHVPGRADGPWIVPGGTLIEAVQPELVSVGVAEGMRRAAQEPKDSDKVRAAVTETSDMLRFWMGGAAIRSEQISELRSRIRKEMESRSLNWRARLFLVSAACLALLAVMAVVIHFIRRRKSRVFGTPQMPRRLGAPYCGGNHAVMSLGSPFDGKPDAGNPG